MAVWLTDVGMAVGRPDGSIAYPQATRVLATADAARPVFVQRKGLKQMLFCGAALGVGAVDNTV